MKKILLLLLLLCGISGFGTENKAAKQILFITSYDTSYKWTSDFFTGFEKSLMASYQGPLNIDFMELGVLRSPGLKVLPHDDETFQQMLQKKRYDLIVSADNAAAELVMKHKKQLPETTAFLFSGYANFDRTKRIPFPNMTGIERIHNFRPTLDLALRLLPQTQKVAVITDASPTGESLYQEFRKATRGFKGPELLFLHGGFLTSQEMYAQLAQLPQDAFVILVNWRSSHPEPYVPFNLVYDKIVRTAQRPVFTLLDTAFDNGAVGGFLMTGSGLGEETAKTALRLLKGEKAADIPIQAASLKSCFNWAAMKQWDLPMGPLPFSTTYINKPPAVWQNWLPESMVLVILLLLFSFWYLLLGEQRRRNRKKLNGLFAALPIQVGVVDAKNKILFLQAGNQFFSGRLPENLSDLPVELLREIEAPIRDVFHTGEGVRREYSVFGQHRQLEFLLLPRELFGKNAVMWISADVTELHEAYTAMSQLAERFRLTLSSIGDAVIVTDTEGSITLMNTMADKLTGCDENQAIGKKLDDVFNLVSSSGNDQKEESPVAKVLRTGKEVSEEGHTELLSADGRKYQIAASAAPIREDDDTISGAVLFFRDVTDEYEKRSILSAQNTILRNATEVANITYFRSDEAGNRTPMGDFRKNWGYHSNGEALSPEEWIDPEDYPLYKREREKILAGKTDTMRIVYRSNPAAGGRYYEMRVIRAPEKTEQGTNEYYGIIQDITDSRENETRYKDNAALLDSIMENLPGYIFVKNMDDQLRYVMCNRGFSTFVARNREEIIGKVDSELFPKEDFAKSHHDDLALLTDNRILDTEEHLRDADGRAHVVRTMKTIVPQTNGSRLLLGMSIDITRQAQLEQERMKMIEKLNNYVQCERIINQCLARISVENSLDTAVNEMLKVIGENALADRCYIFQYISEDKTVSDNIYEWVRAGIESQQSKLRNVDMSSAPAWTRKLLAKQDIIIEDIMNPPEDFDAAGIMNVHGIKSLLVCGIWLNEELWGYIGMDFVREFRHFSESDIHTIHSSMKLFLLAQERFRQMNAIADSVSLQRQIVDNISIPIAIFDKESNIVSANPSLCEVCGIPLDSVSGKKCYDIICGNDGPPEWCPMQKTLTDFKAHSKEVDIHGRRFILTTQPIFDRSHELKYILKSAIDVTELAHQKEQLQEAMEAAQAANRAKSYFIATMSHELRTPLNAVIGYSELLQMGDIPKEDELKDLQAINTAGHTLLNLIDDVLDFSKMETDRLEIVQEPMNLKKLLSEMLTIFRQTAENKKLSLELVLPEQVPWMILDQKRLRQILINLITNAFKATTQGKIVLSADFKLQQPENNIGSLTIQIADTGPGIPSETLELLFEPFRQHAVRGNMAYEGTGLELALSQRLCTHMGGIIKVSSEVGKGSVFTIQFDKVPIVATERRPETPALFPAECSKTDKVILVDDVAMNLKVMSAMFKRLNIPHICCGSAQEAINQMETAVPIAVFTDLWMPDMGGDELADYMAHNPATASVPVVVVTADTQLDQSVARFFKDVLLKPLTIEALKRCLAKHLPQLLEKH